MAKRNRDYKAEYARRVAKAKAENYKNYAQKRKFLAQAKRIAKPVDTVKKDYIETLVEQLHYSGSDFANIPDDPNDPQYWTWFRSLYGNYFAA